MLGLFGLALIILGILLLVLGSFLPWVRAYFRDHSLITQLVWGTLVFLAGCALVIINAIQ
ncbi:hypothetical protein [Eupransor demetentiae]|uniref:Uncharacterized protein n=1 Tax=Eupransor demetentiae TaxID=3109584 RepID=A0ABP0EMG5_9LACO|nr:hypothetical protein R54876_GBNLAHCA_00040 [Lactobacillaceae bacterium LMG 33000]